LLNRRKIPRSRLQKGNALIEFSMLLPWLILIFTSVFDFGFYAYAFICVEGAARAAAVRNAANSGVAGDQSSACTMAIEGLRGLPNVGQSFSSSCTASPITVSASYCSGTSSCGGASSTPDNGQAAYVAVTYQMPRLFRMPIVGPGSITRTAEIRLRDPLP